MKNVEQKIKTLLAWIDPNIGKDSAVPIVSEKLIVKDNQISGRGLYALQAIKPGEKLINIPRQFLLNHATVLKHIGQYVITNESKKVPAREDFVTKFYSGLSLKKIERLSSFQLISMYLVLESIRAECSFWAPFIAMLPELEELSAAPVVAKILNKDSSWASLPRTTRKHSERVLSRYETDYDVVCQIWKTHGILSELHETVNLEQQFLWAWMCINSRCLYMEIPGKEGADNFTMAPYVDFLNHSSHEECGIKIDSAGFQVYTSNEYQAGDELFFSYGPHSNEFLLCEYGFVLPQNKWNYIDLSDLISPLLRPAHVQFLKNRAYYGDYTVNIDGMSFRTEIALATMQEAAPESSKRLSDLIDGRSDGRTYAKASNLLLSHLLQKIHGDCNTKLNKLSEPGFESVCQLYQDMKEICESVLQECQASD